MNDIETQRLHENEQEEKNFKDNLHRLLNGNRQLASRPLVIGKTPYSLAICGADGELPLTITKKVIDKCMRPEIRDATGKRLKNSGHFLGENQLVEALASLKEPVMVLKGSIDNTLVAVTDLKDDQGKEIIVAVEYGKRIGFDEVNSISSIYGKDHFIQYLKNNIKLKNVIAIDIKKADQMLHSIGVDFPEENTFISFDNSIAYTTENVNYPNEKNAKEQDEMAVKKNSFNNFQQNVYDFEALENEIPDNAPDQTVRQADKALEKYAVQIADRYIGMRKTDGGYDCSVMRMDDENPDHFEILTHELYPDPDIPIQDALNDFVDWLITAPRWDGAAGNIEKGDEQIPIDYDTLMDKTKDVPERSGSDKNAGQETGRSSSQKEITLKFAKGCVGDEFQGKDGNRYKKILVPNADADDHRPWQSFVVKANHVHEDQYGKGVWIKLSAEGHTTLQRPVMIGQTPEEKKEWKIEKKSVPNAELKKMVEFYKDKNRESLTGKLVQKKEEASRKQGTTEKREITEQQEIHKKTDPDNR